MVVLANAYYEENRQAESGYIFNIRKVERVFDLKAGKLVSYRGNKNRRKKSGIELVFINHSKITK